MSQNDLSFFTVQSHTFTVTSLCVLGQNQSGHLYSQIYCFVNSFALGVTNPHIGNALEYVKIFGKLMFASMKASVMTTNIHKSFNDDQLGVDLFSTYPIVKVFSKLLILGILLS